jgi:membrane protein DedA with SNARE-associated domain
VVLFGRFIPLLRSFVSFAAGLGEMAIAKFILFTVVGCAVWCAVLTTVGYELGRSYRHVLNGFKDAGYVLAAVVVVAVVMLFVHRLRVVRSERAERP